MKRHVVAGRELVKVAVVADDGANVQRQQAALPAEHQVVEAVAFFADENDGAHRLGHGVQGPLHGKGLGKQLQAQAQVVLGELAAGELHPHEKQAGGRVVVLGCFFDVAAVFQQETRDGVHDARAVLAGKGEDVGVLHGALIVAAWLPVGLPAP